MRSENGSECKFVTAAVGACGSSHCASPSSASVKGFLGEKPRCQRLFDPRRLRARCAGAAHAPLHTASEREWLALGIPRPRVPDPPASVTLAWPGAAASANLPVWRNPAALYKNWPLDGRKTAPQHLHIYP